MRRERERGEGGGKRGGRGRLLFLLRGLGVLFEKEREGRREKREGRERRERGERGVEREKIRKKREEREEREERKDKRKIFLEIGTNILFV